MPSLPSTTSQTTAALQIGALLLDPLQRCLLQGDAPVRIGTRGFDLLHALARAAPQALAANALLRSAWGRTDVDPNNLRVQIAALRKLLGATAIRYEPTRGYRLTLPVRAADAGAGADANVDAGDGAEAIAQAGALAPGEALPGNLPELAASLDGRQADLADLDQALARHARLTLVGPPGVGKTALALAAAQQRRRHAADGAFLVELAPLRSASLVLQAIALVLGVAPAQASTPLALARCLEDRQLLLVLDNAEHVRPAVQAVCDDLLRAAPGVRVLATSRQPLRCAGEHVRLVEPLTLPAADDADAVRAAGAVAMFLARARLSEPRFTVTPANAAAVARICRLVGGVPLALGFAAADLALWGVHGLAERLGRGLAMLDQRRTHSDARHGSIEAAVHWSVELLSPAAQTVLRLLSVFAGNAPLPGVLRVAQAVGLDEASVMRALASLHEHFLLQPDLASLTGSAAQASPARYHLHPLVREHARRLLEASAEESATVLRAHARWAVTLAPDPLYDTPRPAADAQPDRADLDDLRAAMAWACEHDRALALDLCARLMVYWRATGLHAEARSAAAPLVDAPQPDDPPHLMLRLLVRLCGVMYEAQEEVRLLELADRAQAISEHVDDPLMRLLAFAWHGMVWARQGDLPRCLSVFERTVVMAREMGDVAQTATQLGNLAWCLQLAGRVDEGRAALAEALALNQRGGTTFSVAMAHENIAELEIGADRPHVACVHAHDAALGYRRGGYVFRMLLCLVLEAESLRRQERGPEALGCLHEVIDVGRRNGFKGLLRDALGCVAAVLAAMGQDYRALVLLHAADRIGSASSAVGHLLDKTIVSCRAAAEQRLSAVDRHAAMADGESLDLAQALAWMRAAAQTGATGLQGMAEGRGPSERLSA